MSKSKEKTWSKHGRSHSSEQSGNLQSTFMDNRGWIEAVPSRSLDRKQRDSPKDMLGAVSDEDILKLTQLTAEVTTELKQPKAHRHRQEQDDSSKKISSSSHTPESTDNESTRHSEKSSIKTSSMQKEDRRRSWLYKSILKPIKNKGKSKETNEEDSQKTPASAFIDEFYQKQQQQQQQQQQLQLQPQPQEGSSHKANLSKLNTIQVVPPSPLNNSSLNRRHSFDSVQSLVKTPKPSRDSKLNKLLHPSASHHHHNQYQHPKQIPTVTPISTSTLNINNSASNNSHHSNSTNDSNLTPTMAKTDGDVESDSEDKEEEIYQRPSFHLVVSHDSGEEEEEGQEDSVEEEASGNNTSSEPIVTDTTLSDDGSDTIDDQTTLMFDYDSLPPEVRGLIDEYDLQGKVVMKEMFIKDKVATYKEETKEEEEEEDDDDDNITIESSLTTTETQVEELEDKELDIDESDKDQNDDDEQEKDEIVYSHQLISSGSIPNDNKKRKIAIVTTSKYDDIEFTKLIQLDDDTTNGPLIDIHVSLFEVNYDSDMEGGPKEEFQYMLNSIENRISSLDYLKKESREFLNEHQDYLRKLSLEEAGKKTISRTLSYPNLGEMATDASASSYKDGSEDDEEHDSDGTTHSSTMKRRSHNANTLRNARSMYIPDSSLHDPFEYKKYELNHLIGDLRQELKGFQSCLEDTEKLVNSVQLDIDDTRNRMETYIKDIPQSHYSALKTLEVDIDSILSKRAKNPWLDTGYTLLSYLLTLFALVVWIIIYLLKMGKKVLFFPKKLWNSYSDYLLQRNRIVRNASLRSVSH